MMKRFVVLGAGLLASSLTVFAQGAATPTKVGIINIQAAIIGTKEGQAAAKQLEAKSAPKKAELEKAQAEINALRDRHNKMGSVGSEEQKQALMREIDQKTKSFNRQVEDAQAELDQEQGRVLNELGGKMLAVLDKYARDNGYAVILDVSAQNTPVLFAASGIDVTQDVVGLYDKNAATGAPATGTPPTGAAAAPVPATTTAPKPPAATKPGVTAPKPGTAK